ncbi:MAG TPA: IclR family transcriptional regulator [Rubrobacteraceae bacterium]|nr:IclR family transcriptional regulator [Rubrobacteraceae bacterium]
MGEDRGVRLERRLSMLDVPPLDRDGGRGGAKFESIRRVFRILDLVSRREGLTAKLLARDLGVSLSTCYYLVNILIEEGYLEKDPTRKGYRIGAAISTLHERRSGTDLGSAAEPVLEELAQRSGRHAYLGVLSDGAVTVSEVKSPCKSPPVGLVRGFHGASHALALGKVLIAGTGAEGVEDYAEGFGLEQFTTRTIVQPGLFKVHLDRVRAEGVATDVEEFEANLCCVAAPILGSSGEIEGAVGVSTSARRYASEAERMIELVQWAAQETSSLLREGEG